METVTCNWSEMEIAGFCGVQRVVDQLKRGQKDPHGAAWVSPWHKHVTGALAEVGTAKYLGRQWIGMGEVGQRRGVDIAPNVQVRWRGKPDDPLVLHTHDADDSPWVLVTGDAPVFHLHGWILGVHGKVAKYWVERPNNPTFHPAFWIPQAVLKPMAELREYLEAL